MVLFTGHHLGWYVLPIKIYLKKILAPSRNPHPKSSTTNHQPQEETRTWLEPLYEMHVSPHRRLYVPNLGSLGSVACWLVAWSWLQLLLTTVLVVQKIRRFSSWGWQFIPLFTSLYTSQVVVWDFLLTIPNKIHVCMVYLPIHEWLILW